MALLCGSLDGLYRFSNDSFEQTETVLNGRSDAYRFDHTDVLFARGDGELYRSLDEGVTWLPVETPENDVKEIQLSPDGKTLYIGLYPPARLYSCEFDSTWQDHQSDEPIEPDWHERDGFPTFEPVYQYDPEGDRTRIVRERGAAIHDLRVHPEVPSRLVAGIEPAGLYVSDDRGKTWVPRRDGLHDDVHDITIMGPDEYLVATGQGLYHTSDAGQSWTRLDTDQTYFEHTFFHSLLVHDEALYTAAAGGSPVSWRGEHGANAVLLRSTNRGQSFQHESYPGGPAEFVLSWAVLEDRLLAGTMAQSWDDPGTSAARVIKRSDDGQWQTAGTVPAGVV